MRVIRAAAVQLSPVLYSREATVEKVVAKIQDLGGHGVQFATFPETVIPYYPYFSFVQPPLQNIAGPEQRKLLDQAVTVPSRATDVIGEAARQAGIVVSIGVSERDGGTLYNTQLLFDADGSVIQRRRKISPTYHERMIWGQGDGSGLRAVDSMVGRVGQLACWEHYNPLARYAMMADGEEIHSAMYPGSIFGDLFSQQTEVNIRQHALESGCFVVCATAWLNPDQQAQIMNDTGCSVAPISGGCFTAIVAPDGTLLGEPIRSGEGALIADLDYTLIDKRKQLMDSRGHYSRPELLSLLIDRTSSVPVHERGVSPTKAADEDSQNLPTMPTLPVGQSPTARSSFRSVSAAESTKLVSVDPTSGELIESFDEISDADLEAALARAHDTFCTYRRTSFAQRARWLLEAARILEEESRSWARLMTQEMGKTYKAAVAEARKCAATCRYYAENGARFLADEEIETDTERSYVRYLPLGPVLAVMPWNFPFWQVTRFAAPALMAGNVGLLKHASNVSRCALALQKIFLRAGFPEGAFQTLLMSPKRVERVIADDRVSAVTLTGSEAAGSKVAEQAGKHIKKTVMELGGSDPFIVLPSADLEVAVDTAITARNINNGQSCIAAKRFIVHTRVYDEFERRMVEGLVRLTVGDPMDADTDVGPLATEQILETVERQVDESVRAGAQLLTGGKRLGRPGYFYLVSALARIPSNAPAYREEVFGPVALLFEARDLDEAIELANNSDYGLGSSVWTHDEEERRRCIDELEAGATFVNAMVASDPRLPFGGVKRSGYGRELGRHGIREFVNVKAVSITEHAEGRGSDTE